VIVMRKAFGEMMSLSSYGLQATAMSGSWPNLKLRQPVN
jgi:hypothetical protein